MSNIVKNISLSTERVVFVPFFHGTSSNRVKSELIYLVLYSGTAHGKSHLLFLIRLQCFEAGDNVEEFFVDAALTQAMEFPVEVLQ
jgi:hypothetical protein